MYTLKVKLGLSYSLQDLVEMCHGINDSTCPMGVFRCPLKEQKEKNNAD